MAGDAGWYIGRIDVSSVASVKGGTQTAVTDTVFQWTNAKARPTVATANITGLVAIVGGPYPTQAAATAAAQKDKNTTTGGGGTHPGVSVSTVNSSNGHLPSALSGLAAIGDFFARLGDPNTWIRVAKVIAGGTLLIVGLAHMSGADNAIATVARKAPLPV